LFKKAGNRNGASNGCWRQGLSGLHCIGMSRAQIGQRLIRNHEVIFIVFA